MADTDEQNGTLSGLIQEAQTLDDAIAQAERELVDITESAEHADNLALQTLFDNCTIHEVSGVGRYAIPHVPGWQALLDIVHDKSVDINFSPNEYPIFDGVLIDILGSGYLDDPDEPKYDSRTFRNLRDNLAAVRNFLMETYYANTPEGMTGLQARQALQEIATFVGEGLQNNRALFGVVPNHDPSKTFIDLDRASEPDGKGAQYIYEEILKMQRQSSWLRPFEAIVAMFGGKKPVDWMLPSLLETPFTPYAIANAEQSHLAEDEAAARLLNLQQERQALQVAIEDTALAVDLEAMGNGLLDTASRLNDISQVSEPVRSQAVEIARDILRKLKVTMGNINIREGLNMKPGDDVASLGGVQGVATVYERLLAWGRGIDASIAQHPSVMAATQAVGQLGFLAKLEALRVAKAVGNTALVDRLSARIAALPDAYKNTSANSFGELLNRVESGINTVLDRIQAIQGPGAGVGHTPYKDLGSYMTGAPIAGLAMQLTGDGSNRDAAGKRNMEIMAAEEANAQAMASRIQSQNASRAQQQGQQQQTTPSRPARGQQAVQQARQQQQRSSSTASSTNTVATATMTAQQRAALMQRNAAVRAANDHHDEHHHDPVPQKINPQMINPALMNKIKAATDMAGVKGDLVTGKAAYGKMLNANTAGLKPSATPNVKGTAVKPAAANDSHVDALADPTREKHLQGPTVRGGGGRGF